jgi:hypothetical protein
MKLQGGFSSELTLFLSLPTPNLPPHRSVRLLRGQECWRNRDAVEWLERPWDYEA